MTLLLFCFLGWVTIVSISIIPNKLPVTDNLIVFFCLFIFERSAFTVLGLNLGRMAPSQNMELHVAELVTRLILFPTLTLIFVNLYFLSHSHVRRWGAALLILASMNVVHWLAVKLKLLSFHNWNYFYSFLLFICFLVVAYGLEKGLQSLNEKEWQR